MRRLLLLILLFTIGCVPWMQVGGLYTSRSHNFSVELPQGWMRLNKSGYQYLTIDQKILIEHLLIFTNADAYLFITKDGILLQNIIINRGSIDEELKNTKKKLSKGMLPYEAADVIIDNISSDQAVLNFELLENNPVKISGFPGFRIVFTHKNEDGLRLKSIFYGFIEGEWFYSIGYNSALRHYFEEDLKTFEKIFKSFKLTKSV
jgi:hypothetical protein